MCELPSFWFPMFSKQKAGVSSLSPGARRLSAEARGPFVFRSKETLSASSSQNCTLLFFPSFSDLKKKNRCCSCDFSERRGACLTGDQRFRQLGGFFPSLKIVNNCTKISNTLARVPNSAGVLKGYSFYLEDLILKNCPVVLYVHHILNGCFFFSLQEYQVTFGPRCYFTF